ncbi:MAG: 1,4-alpha-glucan branching protein GlgB [Oscillospiraceae bacterium]|nr:1,4-alpha-glucan branching protein GlgB [Oscillospiraceae bacterium]MDD6502379.1 1,4-alpha-glucan branching protein GlgB [Oscillospiraceae bacterium]MDY4105550.1 1,4-alpha-glucan branching protein GlgB [Oscillospiraceae bacterium]
MDQHALAEKYIDKQNIYRFNDGNASDAYETFGCRYLPDAGCYRFVVWAPHAKEVSVIGDFNGWNGAANPMIPLECGVWAAFIPEAYPGNIYKFRITTWDGRVLEKADPFAFSCESGPKTGSRVCPLDPFEWHDQDYQKALKKKNPYISPMSIYEVHLGSWKKPWDGSQPNYREVGRMLAEYCTDMGYTHVELMPVTEYPYDPSWGYQVTGYFAPASKYGTPEDFASLVDTLHAAGIGVIMDWVPAHFPKDAYALAKFDGSPLFESDDPVMSEHPDWGTLIFDYTKGGVRSFLMSSAAWFLDRYHIDGIRVDAVASMLYLDFGRKPGEWTPNWEGGNINHNAIYFLQRLNEEIHRRFHYTLMIAEESTAFPKITEPVALGGLGFDFKWNMGYMHDTLEYMELDPIYRKYHHDKIKLPMCYSFSEKYVLPYSHDEVVYGKGSMIGKMSGDYYQKFHSLRTLWGFTFAHPGKKLMFMGSEIAQFDEWDFRSQIQWNLLEFHMHAAMQNYVRELNRFYKATPALHEIEQSWDGFTWLNDTDADSSALAFMRTARDGSHIVAVCNFTPVRQDFFPVGLPGPGTLREALNSDDARFGGHDVHNMAPAEAYPEPFCGQPWSARVTLPPMSCVYYYYDTKEGSET